MAMAATIVHELAMAFMAPSSPSFSRVFQTGSHLKLRTPCFSKVLNYGSQSKSCLGGALGVRSGALRGFSCRASSSSWSEHAELPEKLQEIVKVFQGVTEPRAKCEQLLYYAARLKPLAEEQKQPENKVEGCVSKVYIVCEFDEKDGRVYFEAESDVMLTKGLAGLLVEGLSGVTVEEVLKLTPDFVHMLGLKQSLTPSRSNGFLNMLKLIQKKTLQVYSNSITTMVAGNASVLIASIDTLDSLSHHGAPSLEAPQTKKYLIEKKLTEGLTPVQLEEMVTNLTIISVNLAQIHKRVPSARGPRRRPVRLVRDTFNVKNVSEQFQGRSLLKRNRLVHDLLQAELQEGGVHAISLSTKTPSEIAPKS